MRYEVLKLSGDPPAKERRGMRHLVFRSLLYMSCVRLAADSALFEIRLGLTSLPQPASWGNGEDSLLSCA